MKNKKVSFPKGFFSNMKSKNNDFINTKEKELSFKWSKNVLNGKSKVRIVALEK